MSVYRKWIDLHEDIENLYYRDAIPDLRVFQIRYNKSKGTRIPLYYFKHILGYKRDKESVAKLVLNLKNSKGLVDGADYIRREAQLIRSQSLKRKRAFKLASGKLSSGSHTAPSNSASNNSIFH